MAIDKPLDPNILIQFPLLTEDAIRMKLCYDNDHDPYSRYGDWDLIAVKEEWAGNKIKKILYFQCPRCHHVEEDEIEGSLSEEEKKKLEEEDEKIDENFNILFIEDEEKLKDEEYAKKVAIANAIIAKIIHDIHLEYTSPNVVALKNLKTDIMENLVKDSETGEFKLADNKKMSIEYNIVNDTLAIPKIIDVESEFSKEFQKNSPITAIKSEMKAQEKKKKQIYKIWKKAQKKQKRQNAKTAILNKLVILNILGEKKTQKKIEVAVEEPITNEFIAKNAESELSLPKQESSLNITDVKASNSVIEISVKEESKTLGPIAMAPTMTIGTVATEEKEEIEAPVKEIAKEQKIEVPKENIVPVKEEKYESRNTGNSRPSLEHKKVLEEELTEQEKMENIVKFGLEEKLASKQRDLAESSVSTLAEEVEIDNVNIDFPTLNNNPENTPEKTEETEENVVKFENPNSNLMTPMPSSNFHSGNSGGENAA